MNKLNVTLADMLITIKMASIDYLDKTCHVTFLSWDLSSIIYLTIHRLSI